MKNLKFLLLGLIFALVCSVSIAGPPGSIPSINSEEKNFISIDQAVLPAITIENLSFADQRQHRSESQINYINENENPVNLVVLSKDAGYIIPSTSTYGINKSYLLKDNPYNILESHQYSPPDHKRCKSLLVFNQRE